MTERVSVGGSMPGVDPADSAALIFGLTADAYEEGLDALTVTSAARDLGFALSDRHSGGLFDVASVDVVTKVGSPQDVFRRIAKSKASGVLLVYLAGHVHIGPGQGLSFVGGSSLSLPSSSFLTVESVLSEVVRTPARYRVVIFDADVENLDVRALPPVAGTAVFIGGAAQFQSRGRYPALASALIDLLRRGVPGGPQFLSIASVHEQLQQRLDYVGGRAEQVVFSPGGLADLEIARNVAYAEPDSTIDVVLTTEHVEPEAETPRTTAAASAS